MSATLLAMEYSYADLLNPDQLLVGDLIEVFEDDEFQIVEIKSIEAAEFETWLLTVRNSFDETLDILIADSAKVKLFVLK